MVVASSEFIDAAQKQADALGLPEVRRVFVPHPIQDATDDQKRAKADAIVNQVIAGAQEIAIGLASKSIRRRR